MKMKLPNSKIALIKNSYNSFCKIARFKSKGVTCLLIKFSQVVGIPRSQNLCALQVLQIVRSFANELRDFVWTFPIRAKLFGHRVLGIPNNLSENKVANQKFSVLDLLVVCFG